MARLFGVRLSVLDAVARSVRHGVAGTGIMGRGHRKRGRARRAVGWAHYAGGRLQNTRRAKRRR